MVLVNGFINSKCVKISDCHGVTRRSEKYDSKAVVCNAVQETNGSDFTCGNRYFYFCKLVRLLPTAYYYHFIQVIQYCMVILCHS